MVRWLVFGFRSFGVIAVAWAAALGSTFVFRPIEVSVWQTHWSLWREDVKSWQGGALTGYERDHCAGAPECACIALVHGLGDDALTWKRILTRPVKQWSRAVRLVAVNLPGTGDSAAPADPTVGYRARKMGETVAESLRADSRCDRWTVVGNSLGGWVSVWAALSWPEGIRKMVLVDSVGLRDRDSSSGANLLTEPTVESLKEFQAKAYFKPRELPEAVWKAAVKRAAKGNSRQVRAAQTDEDYLDSYLGGLKIPVLLLWGDSDRIISPEKGRELGAKIRGAQFREARQCGHMPQKECPDVMIGVIDEMIRFGAM